MKVMLSSGDGARSKIGGVSRTARSDGQLAEHLAVADEDDPRERVGL